MPIPERMWPVVHRLAAELVVYHKDTTDINLIEKTMHYITNTRSNAEGVKAWLTIQMQYAGYFERSLQTLRQMATALALVEEFSGETDRPDVLAEALGWVVRLTRYYLVEKEQARAYAPRKTLSPKVPEAKPIIMPPVMRDDDLLLPANERSSEVASDITAIFERQAAANMLEEGLIINEIILTEIDGPEAYFDLSDYGDYRGYVPTQPRFRARVTKLDVIVEEIEGQGPDGLTYVRCKSYRR